MEKKNRFIGCLNAKAFTLIELLVVVLIIGILAAIALPQYEKSVMKSRYATMMDIVSSVAQAEEVYYLANGSYTSDFESLAVIPSGCTLSDDKTTCTYPWGTCVLNTQYGRVGCVNTQSLKNAHIQFFPHGPTAHYGKTCWAISSTKGDKYGKLCEGMGAVYEGKHDLIGVAGGIHMYKF